MNKIALAATIALSIATLSHAATGKGYREFGEEMFATPGADVHVESLDPHSDLYKAIQRADELSEQQPIQNHSYTITHVSKRYGKINRHTMVDSYHHFKIVNHTADRQRYEKQMFLDCEPLHLYYRRYVEVDAGGFYESVEHNFGAVKKSQPGDYKITAETLLTGESSDTSVASNILHITQPKAETTRG